MGLKETTADIPSFYDRWTELFQRGFGPVLQAGIIRTGDPLREDPEASVRVLADRAGILDGDRVLDAGCGVAGPATIIARAFAHTRIDAITNSTVQARIARDIVARAELSDRVAIHVGDYESLPFESSTFDVVCFFESTGYATDLDRMYSEAARVLAPGGRLYVKDVFSRSGGLEPDEREQLRRFDELWGCARTKGLYESAEAIASTGLVVQWARVMDDIGTALLAGSMFTMLPDGGLAPTEMGRSFAPRDLRPPIEFGEILATRPR